MKNKLHVGLKRKIEKRKGVYLLIDREVPANMPLVEEFDPRKRSIEIVGNLNERQALELAETFYSCIPGGENTLTVRNGIIGLAEALLEAESFEKLESDKEEVQGVIDRLKFLPVIRHSLNGRVRPFAVRRDTKIAARLNPGEIGTFACRVIGRVLMTMFKGQIIVKDFGLYGCKLHENLIYENRLIAGVNFLKELEPELRRAVLLIEEKEGRGCLYEDAVTLAEFAGLRPDPTRVDNNYNRFIDAVMA